MQHRNRENFHFGVCVGVSKTLFFSSICKCTTVQHSKQASKRTNENKVYCALKNEFRNLNGAWVASTHENCINNNDMVRNVKQLRDRDVAKMNLFLTRDEIFLSRQTISGGGKFFARFYNLWRHFLHHAQICFHVVFFATFYCCFFFVTFLHLVTGEKGSLNDCHMKYDCQSDGATIFQWKLNAVRHFIILAERKNTPNNDSCRSQGWMKCLF